MVARGKKKGTLRFSLAPDADARCVAVAGDFNNWQPVRMRKGKGGGYVAVIPVSTGTCEYKFIVDDEWRTDPDNHTWAVNPSGTVNSVAAVE